MRTIKLVIIGDSGVGKEKQTSLRSSYVSGRFSTGYRATIGTDFITKVLSHHSNLDEAVTLQIWDTAGQERFSSLSTAFFRGADAVLMMYDVNRPQTLQGLKKWWKEFQERAPVSDEDASDYCCVVVGNKIDLAEELEYGRNMLVSEEDAQRFLEQLIPLAPGSPISSPLPPLNPNLHQAEEPHSALVTSESSASPQSHSNSVGTGADAGQVDDTQSESSTIQPKPIDIRHSGRGPSVSRATSRSRLGGTMTTTHTSLSIYHTPSSSFFDEFVSAPSSPIHSNTHSPASSTETSHIAVPTSASRRRPTTSTSSSSETITPSLFARPPSTSTTPTPLPLDRGPRLFLTSAKSGQSVSLVFEYIAKRVVSRWEWEETVQERALDYSERPSEIGTVHLSQSFKESSAWRSTCCS